MIPIFRKIRRKLAEDNKPIKYLRYAIGEILLVVIGILIALQINNWNEKQKEKRLFKAYASSLISDLQKDIKNIELIKNQMKQYIFRIDSLANYTRGKQISELSNISLLPLMLTDIYRPYAAKLAFYRGTL